MTGAVVNDLALHDQNVGVQVQAIAAQVAHWARLAAQAKRVWEIEERDYRIWRSGREVFYHTEPDEGQEKRGWARTKTGAPKKPANDMIDSLIRTEPAYREWQNRIERAEEACTSAEGILEAFKAKRDMIRTVVWRNRDTGQPELSV